MLTTPALPEARNVFIQASEFLSNDSLAKKSSPVLTNPRAASTSKVFCCVNGSGGLPAGTLTGLMLTCMNMSAMEYFWIAPMTRSA